MAARGTGMGHHLAAALLGLVLAGAAAADEGPAPSRGLDDQTAIFVLGNIEFVLVHELAHLIIGEYQVPVFGPEEVAADYIAATALIRQESVDAERGARAKAYLIAAADAFNLSWQKGRDLGAAMPYWGAHALNIQRFYQVACLLYGSDTALYAEVPKRIGMPDARARDCGHEFARAMRSLGWLIDTYGRKPGEAPGHQIRVEYAEPASLVERAVLARIRERQMLEYTAARFEETFVLAAPVTFVARPCGRAEAAWRPETRQLVVCYELMDTFYQLAGQLRASGEGQLIAP